MNRRGREGLRWSRAVVALTVAVLLSAACAVETPSGERGAVATEPEITEPEITGPATTEPAATALSEPTAALPAPTATAEPTVPPEPTPQPTATAEPRVVGGGPCDAGPLATPNPDRPRYEVALTVDPFAGTVNGDMRVRFAPDLDIDRLVLRLWPNSPRHVAGGGSMTLTNVLVDGVPATPSFAEPTTATIALAELLAAGTSVEIEAQFSIVLPGEGRSRLSHRVDYQRLGTIIPLLPWEPGSGWAEDPPTSLFAESVSSPVADWSVSIDVPDDYGVLASGVDDGTGTWELTSGRDFAITVGKFEYFSGTALAPDPVTVTVGVHETVVDNGQAYLDKVIDSLEQFSSRWGAYPWPSLTFSITPNLAGGIEFPTHIMQGPNTIGRTTSHEVGHMYFYSLVGNNQGSAPWLDEGLTSYAEFTYEGTAPGAFEIPVGGQGRATEPMTFWEPRSDLYYRSVYSQTGFALQRLADQETVDCALAHYVAANAHQIATADEFVAAFEPWIPTVREDLAALGVDLRASD